MTHATSTGGQGWLRRAGIAAILLLGLGLPLAGAARAQDSAPAVACGTAFPAYDRASVTKTNRVLANREITMSDGVVIRADVTLPAGVDGPFPTALTITGYGKTSPISGIAGSSSDLVNHGYVTVMVDDRGTGSSGGTWDSWGPRTVADYTEVLDWIVAQPWSDGRIGITGGSYMGITSLYAAASGHPAVKAVFATVPMADAYRDIVLGGGQVNTAFIPLWMGLVTALSLQPNAPADTLVDHLLGLTQFQLPMLTGAVVGGAPDYDGPFWRQRSPIEVVDKITAPTFIVGGLDDIFQRGEPLLYERLADNADTRLLIGPWTHTTTGGGLPRNGVPSAGRLLLQWFDAHVLGLDTGAACIPKVTQYVRGHDRYESAPSWPVPNLSAQRWHLQGNGNLTTAAPPEAGASRQYAQLPVTGICTRSAAQWLIGLTSGLPCATDNRLDESIGSLTYTSAPFDEEIMINGPIQADVWVTSTTPDAVMSVAVSDVAPDGTSLGLTNGLLTASHRVVDEDRARLLDGQSIQPWHPFTEAAKVAVIPGRPMLLPIEVFPTSAAIAPGHRLRITIAPFDVPHALPPLPAALDTLAGTVTVLSDAAHPSSVVLPIVGASDQASAAAAVPASADAVATSGASSSGPAATAPAATNMDGTTTAGAARRSLPKTGGAGLDLLVPALVLGALFVRRTARSSG